MKDLNDIVVFEVSHAIRGPDPKTGQGGDFSNLPDPDENIDFISR